MMTREELTAIQARSEAATNGTWDWTRWPNGIRQIYKQDVPTLLRALKEAIKTCPNGGNDGYITPRPCQCEMESTEADRNRWKARSESLERAIRGECRFCKIIGHTIDDKTVASCCDCIDKELWQFDEARFSGKEVNNER